MSQKRVPRAPFLSLVVCPEFLEQIPLQGYSVVFFKTSLNSTISLSVSRDTIPFSSFNTVVETEILSFSETGSTLGTVRTSFDFGNPSSRAALNTRRGRLSESEKFYITVVFLHEELVLALIVGDWMPSMRL